MTKYPHNIMQYHHNILNYHDNIKLTTQDKTDSVFHPYNIDLVKRFGGKLQKKKFQS